MRHVSAYQAVSENRPSTFLAQPVRAGTIVCVLGLVTWWW
jgi:hypothetical protein